MTTANSLSIVEPITLTDSMLISTNVPENDYTAWSGATTYGLGARVIVLSNHTVYESLQASNTNNDPLTSPNWWIRVSPTNRWKAFDTSNSTQTLTPGGSPATISYTIRPGSAVTSAAILNITGGTSVRIRLVDPTYGTVYDVTTDLTGTPITSSWWAWFFGQKKVPRQHVATDIPAFPNADLIIDLEGTSELAVGVIMFGSAQTFGVGVSYGARVGIQDYSRKETNQFGDVELVQRQYAKRANFDMMIASSEVDLLQNYLAEIRTTPVLWIGSSAYEATVLFGFYKNFDILISYPEHSDCSLDIEGLT